MNNELKVSFYLKREGNTERTETNPDAVFSIVGKIIIGNSIAQFGSKLKIEERLWSVKSGRAIGKSRAAVELNRRCLKRMPSFFCYAALLLSIFILKPSLFFSIIFFREVILQK